MAKGKTTVVTCNVSGKVAGKELNIFGADLILQVNAIPKVVLHCDPVGGIPGKKTEVASPTIDEYVKEFNSLIDKVGGLGTTGSFSAQLFENGSQYDSVDIKEWVLSGVGLTRVSPTSAPTLDVTLSHPAVRLTKLGGIYEEPKGNFEQELERDAASGSIVATWDKVYKAYAESSSFRPLFSEPQGICSQYRKALGDKENLPSTYLEDKTGVFLCGESTLALPMKRAVAGFLAPSKGGGSTWSYLIGSVCPNMLVSVVPGDLNSGKLVLEPTSPWKDKSVTIDDSKINTIEFPGFDPYMICGAICGRPGLTDYHQYNYQFVGDKENTNDGNAGAMFVPKGLTPTTSDGLIQICSTPRLLNSAIGRNGAVGGNLQSVVYASSELPSAIKGPLLKYLKAFFQISVRSQVTSSVICMPYFDKGNVTAGKVYEIKGGENGKTLMYGYAVGVRHHISTSDGSYTSINMSHVRGGDGEYRISGVTVAKNGDTPGTNAAY